MASGITVRTVSKQIQNDCAECAWSQDIINGERSLGAHHALTEQHKVFEIETVKREVIPEHVT